MDDLKLKIIYHLLNYSCYPIDQLPDLPTLQDVIANELEVPVTEIAEAVNAMFEDLYE